MTFEDLIKKELLYLPKKAPINTSFRLYIHNLLDEYIDLLSALRGKTVKIEGLSNPKRISNSIKIQQEFVRGLKNTIDLYLDGQPYNAYLNLMIQCDIEQDAIKIS